MTEPAITCTKCRSTVPWGPYCPRCEAYLEFFGEPPWHPPVPDDEAETEDGIGDADDADGAGAAGDAPTEELVSVTEAAVPVAAPSAPSAPSELPASAEPAPPPPAGADRRRRGPGTWVLAGFVLLACTLAALLFDGAGVRWAAAGAAVLGVALVAIVLWQPRAPQAAPAPDAVPEPPADQPEAPQLPAPAAPEPLVAREPQVVPTTIVEATPVMAVREPEGTVPCAECGRMNVEGRSLCTWCGAVIPGASLEPDLPHVDLVERAEQDARVRRRVGRSWRVPAVILSLVAVFVAAFLTALFGPRAFEFRLGITNVYQAAAQLVNPFIGTIPRIVRADASSSLPGTYAKEIYGSDARTFWASASGWGYGVGSELTFAFEGPKEVNRLVIFPGTQGMQFGARALATPRKMTLRFDDGSTEELEADPVDFENDFRQIMKFPPRVTERVTLVIDSVYPPDDADGDATGYGEVAISALYFIEEPRPPQIINLPTATDRLQGR